MVMKVEQFYLDCLSHLSYLATSNGAAVVIDPRRDVEIYLEAAAREQAKIVAVVLTHLHADFISGHLELAARTGARVYISHRADASFDHIAVYELDVLPIGDARFVFVETPGHTPESISVLAFEGTSAAKPHAVFTGDTLFSGDVGRPDLAGAKGFGAEEMAEMLYNSLHIKLLALPDDVIVYPAHTAGSSCGKRIGIERMTTIGREAATNHALAPMRKDEFIRLVTSDLTPPPRYFAYDAELNRTREDALYAPAALPSLSPGELHARLAAGAVALDVRTAEEFGAGHVPGAINLPLPGRFAHFAGSLLDPTCEIALIAPSGVEAEEARVCLARIGLDRVAGVLEGGMDRWAREGFEVRRTRQLPPAELASWEAQTRAAGEKPQIIDVRSSSEVLAGKLPGAIHVPITWLVETPNALAIDPERPTLVVCGTGYRSSAACGLLEQRGFRDLINLTGGMKAWDVFIVASATTLS
jgi:hydroxyacylglutathione hydrolase